MKFVLLIVAVSLMGCIPKMTAHSQCQDILVEAQRSRECFRLFEEYKRLMCVDLK